MEWHPSSLTSSNDNVDVKDIWMFAITIEGVTIETGFRKYTQHIWRDTPWGPVNFGTVTSWPISRTIQPSHSQSTEQHDYVPLWRRLLRRCRLARPLRIP